MNRFTASLFALPLLVACAETADDPTLETSSAALLAEEVVVAEAAPAVASVVDAAPALVEAAPTLREVVATPVSTEFGAIGASIRHVDGAFIVADVLDDMPAEDAGIAPDSQVLAVDGVETVDMSMATFLDFVRGTPGEAVTLTVVTPEGATSDVTIEREPLVVEASYCDRVRDMRRDTEFGGIGVHVAQDGCAGDVVVRDVMAGLPAEAAGVQAGDRIVSVDGLDATGAGLNTVVLALRGEAGQPVTLGVVGADGSTRDVIVERVSIATPEANGCR